MVGITRTPRQAAFVAHRVEKRFVAGVPGCRVEVSVLRGASIVVRRGEVVVLVGPAGAGKSTLMLCAAGLLRPDRGALRWYGADAPDVRRTAYVRSIGQAREAQTRLAHRGRGLLLVDAELGTMRLEEQGEAECMARDAADQGTAVVLCSRSEPPFRHVPWRGAVIIGGVIREAHGGAQGARISPDRVAERGASSVDSPLGHL